MFVQPARFAVMMCPLAVPSDRVDFVGQMNICGVLGFRGRPLNVDFWTCEGRKVLGLGFRGTRFISLFTSLGFRASGSELMVLAV